MIKIYGEALFITDANNTFPLFWTRVGICLWTDDNNKTLLFHVVKA